MPSLRLDRKSDPPRAHAGGLVGVTNKTRVLFVVNADWFFLSHRLPLAIAARNAGAEVIVVAGDTGKAGAIRDQGFEIVNLPMSRAGTNPLSDDRTLGFLVRLYRLPRSDLVP